MQIIVLCDHEQKAELLSKKKNDDVAIDFIDNVDDLVGYQNADALFVLKDVPTMLKTHLNTEQPVFLSSVTETLDDLNLPGSISRINGWPTFLQRDIWEVATKNNVLVERIFKALGWKYLITPDEPGLIAARIISMIINEAYFAFEDNVSSKDQIDLAMKLGTNYPYGPFEWSEKIGLRNIYDLLKKLNKTSPRYALAATIKKELERHK
jgi:3-hydroxybutyryl-CoA dehydrogenase